MSSIESRYYFLCICVQCLERGVNLFFQFFNQMRFKISDMILNRWFTLGIIIIGTCVMGVLIAKLDMTMIAENLLEFFRFEKGADTGRISLWRTGIEDFREFPLFGVGFEHGYNAGGIEFSNVYSNMYHNIVVEMLGSMGILGILAFVFHALAICAFLLKKISGDKMLILLTPLIILAMSMVDNFFFYPNFQIVYTAFLVIAETYFGGRREEKSMLK